MEHSDQKCGASMINTKQHYSLHGSVQVIFGIRLLMVSKKISFDQLLVKINKMFIEWLE